MQAPSFGPAQIEELAKLERVVGLAEVMDYLDVIHGGDRMMDIIRTAQEHGLYRPRVHAPHLWRELDAVRLSVRRS